MKLIIILSTLIALSYAEPWFCHNIDCPNYQSKNISGGIELRTYNKTLWVSTEVLSTDYTNASETGFMRLFDYISGHNEKNIKIPMTSPVRMSIKPGDGPFCKSNFTISFFLPFDYQIDGTKQAPQPTAKNVKLTSLDTVTVAVSSFGGYASMTEISNQISNLGDSLNKLNIPFQKDPYTYAGYDPPFRVFNRHNEVWLQLLNN